MRGEQDDGDFRPVAPDAFEQREPVGARHPYVAHDDVDRIPLEHPQCLVAGARVQRLEPGLDQQGGEHLPYGRVVVDHQYPLESPTLAILPALPALPALPTLPTHQAQITRLRGRNEARDGTE